MQMNTTQTRRPRPRIDRKQHFTRRADDLRSTLAKLEPQIREREIFLEHYPDGNAAKRCRDDLAVMLKKRQQLQADISRLMHNAGRL